MSFSFGKRHDAFGQVCCKKGAKNMDEKINIGISSCLLGEKVRFDGSHKHERYLTGTLGEFFHWVPTCPEVAIGLPVPRPTIRLQSSEDGPRLIEPKAGTDLTDKMAKYARKRAKELQSSEIYGYILKSKSPSCGMARIKIYKGHGVRPATNGQGVFAKELGEVNPDLPIEEEGRLMDYVLRENWVRRVFAYYAFKNQVAKRPTVGKMVGFHSRYKFSILSHCEASYRELGQIVAGAKQKGALTASKEYQGIMMAAMKKRATKAKHVNVMEHLFGFFKKVLDKKVRDEIRQSIQDYKKGYVSMIVPVTLLRHYANMLEIEYLQSQSYLNPHPKQLALLSTI